MAASALHRPIPDQVHDHATADDDADTGPHLPPFGEVASELVGDPGESGVALPGDGDIHPGSLTSGADAAGTGG